MCRRMSYLICVVLVMALANSAAATVYLEFDCGICDIAWLQPGWISIPRCGVYEDVGGTPVDVNVATGGNDCGCRGYFDENTSDPPCYDPCPPVGPLAGVEQDFLMNDDCGPDSPCGDVILTFSELDAGAPYTVTSYHNRLDQLTSYISGVVVTGATDVTAPGSIGQQHSMFLESGSPPQVHFTAGAGDVVVRYVHPTSDCGNKGCQVFMNGFVLEGGNTEAYFESASGSALENSGPVNVWVNLSNPAEETIYLYFARTGGTATIGSDYTLPASPLVFNPGEISKAIQITVMNDGSDEQDETIELQLTSVTGTNVVLGETTVHTHTILDPRPAVGFGAARSMLQETDPPLEVTVTLSEAAGGTVTVQYAATSGSASNGIDYYLEPNTLTFDPGQTSKTFTIEPYVDTKEEVAETIVVTLSNATGAKWGLTQHTCTLFDPWTDVSFPKFKVDLGCPARPDTFKDGWTAWEIPEGCNGQPNYGTGISDIGGTNIDAYINPEGDTGNGNLRLSAYGEAICNTSYGRYSGSDQEVAVELTFSGSGLTAGEYWLYGYHNAAGLGTISSITATGPAVIQKEPVVDIPIQEITSDYDLVPSLVSFLTDGSAPVTITYHAGTASNAVVNAFELRTTARPLTASNPDPFDGALDVDPNVVLGWENGKLALSHNVYLGTDFNSVRDATTSSPEFIENRPLASNWYDPPDLLEFGVDYYWRIDEIKGATTYKGEVWFFSTDDGKARNPVPMDGGRALFDQALLSWDVAPHATWHDVYFGTDFNDVNDATTTDTRDVYKGQKELVDNSYAPGTLQTDVTYFWRIDEVGTATFHKGDVWSFSTAGRIDLKVDFALPYCGAADYSEHWPESAKPGWEIWAQPRWHDMYGHDAVLNDGSGLERSLGADFNGPGIGGTGIMAGITCVYEGRGGLIMSGPEMCNLNGSCECPTVSGTPLYEPICNTWFDITDYPGLPGSIVLLMFYNIPPGEYALFGYHNRYGGERNGDQPHWECMCRPQLPMTSIGARAIAGAENLWGSGYDYGKISGGGSYELGSPDGVELIQGDYNVPVQQVATDDELIPSMIKFRTDGSAVMVMYTGTCGVPDDIRPARISCRAVLNAFRLVLLSEAMMASDPTPYDGAPGVSPDIVLKWRPGPSADTHEVYFGTSFDDVNDATTSSDVYQGTTTDSQYDPPGYLAFETTYYWRVDEVNEAVAPGYWKGPVWTFATGNGKARNPSPTDGTTEVLREAQLSWEAGEFASSHDVYLGTSFDEVANATTSSGAYVTTVGVETTTYDPPGLLDYGRTYYWRIDENNPLEKKTGDVWRFTVQRNIIVDDMESYDSGGDPIYWTWEDGAVNWSGSIIWLGGDPDPCEPVHGGEKSMGYLYDHTGWLGAYYAIVSRTFAAPWDWTDFNVKVVTLWFYGDPNNDATDSERMYMGLDDTSVPSNYAEVTYGDNGEDTDDVKVAEWHDWRIDLQDFSDGGVSLQDVNTIYIGFGHPEAQSPSGAGTVYFDDIRLYIPPGYPNCWNYLTQCHGDCDNTGDVKGSDFLALKNSWYKVYGEPAYDPCADFDRNGEVKGSDFLILKNNWYQTVPADCAQGDINGIYQ